MGISRLDAFSFPAFNANGTSIDYSGPVDGLITVTAFGTFGGGTVTLNISHDGENWVPVSGIAITQNQAQTVQLVSAKGVQAVLTGATNPNLTVQIGMIEY